MQEAQQSQCDNREIQGFITTMFDMLDDVTNVWAEGGIE